MTNIKEFTSDELLAFVFLSRGLNKPITTEDLNMFMDVVFKYYARSTKNFNRSTAFNIPMRNNYDGSLFKSYYLDDETEGFYIIDHHMPRQHFKVDKIFLECVQKRNITIDDFAKISDKFKKKLEEKERISKEKEANVASIYNKVKRKVLFLIK